MIECPRCGHEQPDDAEFCAACRAFLGEEGTGSASRGQVRLVDDALQPLDSLEPSGESGEVADEVECGVCGSFGPVTDETCWRCGAPRPSSAQSPATPPSPNTPATPPTPASRPTPPTPASPTAPALEPTLLAPLEQTRGEDPTPVEDGPGRTGTPSPEPASPPERASPPATASSEPSENTAVFRPDLLAESEDARPRPRPRVDDDVAPPVGQAVRPDQLPEARPTPAERREVVASPPSGPTRPASLGPGEVACASCGTPNDDSRRFCQKCGAGLPALEPLEAAQGADAVSVAPPSQSWWRRLTGRSVSGSADRRSFSQKMKDSARDGEGTWRRGLGVRARALRVVGLVALVTGGALMLGPWGPDLRREAGERLDGLLGDTEAVGGVEAVAVPPEPVVAGFEDPADAVDGQTDQAWATTWDPEAAASADLGECREDPSPAGAELVLTFSSAEDLRKVSVFGGLDESLDRDLQRTPAEIDLVFLPGTECRRLTLEEKAGRQTFDVEVDGVESVKAVIRATHPPVSDGEDVVAISDISFES